ncbi:MAG: hypothetical protein DME26_12655, partial [Verrucomicrobia bacterium]
MKTSSPRSTLFYNCRLAYPDFLAEGALLAENGTIAAVWIAEPPSHVPVAAQKVDCQNLILAPGLIDIHNHGGLTHDFVAANANGNKVALRFHSEQGVTSMLATVMTETHEQMCAALKLLGDQHTAGELPPNFIGIHIEGPYFHPEIHARAGAQRLGRVLPIFPPTRLRADRRPYARNDARNPPRRCAWSEAFCSCEQRHRLAAAAHPSGRLARDR